MSKEEGPKWLTYLKRAGYVATALVAIGGLVYGVNGHYQSAEAAESTHTEIRLASDSADYQANRDREKGDIRTQIELINLELKFLERNPDETRKDYLLQQRQILLQRLQELQGSAA